MNFRPINEVPEIEALTEGDKLLVNSNGTARQIDAEKVNPILKAPEAEELTEGDKILVNSGGNIVKVDASKVGGKGGGGGIIYTNAVPSGETIMAPAFADPECTTQFTYEQGLEILASGGKIQFAMDEQIAWFTPMALIPMPDNKVVQGICVLDGMMMIILMFSDSNMGD